MLKSLSRQWCSSCYIQVEDLIPTMQGFLVSHQRSFLIFYIFIHTSPYTGKSKEYYLDKFFCGEAAALPKPHQYKSLNGFQELVCVVCLSPPKWLLLQAVCHRDGVLASAGHNKVKINIPLFQVISYREETELCWKCKHSCIYGLRLWPCHNMKTNRFDILCPHVHMYSGNYLFYVPGRK